jgi:glycine dehydrogenase subunit 1
MDYTSIAAEHRAQMLETIGVDSVDELFSTAPEPTRITSDLDLPAGASELELQRELADLASRNRATDQLRCFAGAGAYDHFIPAFIDQLISRGEFLTAYTPYQGEASQGSLQSFFEFQTQITRLTGLDISNASLYEGASATAEAVLLALHTNDQRRVLVAGTLHPDYRRVLRTVLDDLPVEIVEIEPGADGRIGTDAIAAAATDDTACLVVQSPSFTGLIEDWEALFGALKAKAPKALAIAVFNPLACALLKSPGACGADVAAGEGQPLGIPLQLGGPYLGLFAARKQFLRKMPGRLVGQTTDADGRRAFCLALQTREQHIRGKKATSNVCTNQGLLALRATMYMTAMGPQGLREVAEQSWHKAHHLAKRIADLPGYALKHDAAFFNEFVVTCPKPAQQIVDHAKSHGVLAGVALSSPRVGSIGADNELLIAVTEKRSREDLDLLITALQDAGECA